MPNQLNINIYNENKISNCRGKIKLLIGCRTQKLQSKLDELNYFIPYQNNIPNYNIYCKRYVAQFTKEQTNQYIEKYVKYHQTNENENEKDKILWNVNRYQIEFKKIPELNKIIDTPFMLYMLLGILPNLINNNNNDNSIDEKKEKKKEIISKEKLTRAKIYDLFMEQWFIRQAQKSFRSKTYLKDSIKILGKDIIEQIKDNVTKEGENGYDIQIHLLKSGYETFCLTLSQYLFEIKQINICYDKDKEKYKWIMEMFDDENSDMKLLRQGSPLRESSDHTWSFIHASIYDYFITKSIVKQLLLPSSKDSIILKSSNNILLSIESYEKSVMLLSQEYLTKDEIFFIIDRMNPLLEKQLFCLIERSKTEKEIAIASANAITILNFSGKYFQI